MIDWTNELFEEKTKTRIPMTRELLDETVNYLTKGKGRHDDICHAIQVYIDGWRFGNLDNFIRETLRCKDIIVVRGFLLSYNILIMNGNKQLHLRSIRK